MTERYDRNTLWLHFISASPIFRLRLAAYAASPIAEVTAANFNVKGGYQFCAVNRGIWAGDANNVQPGASGLRIAWGPEPSCEVAGVVHCTVYHLWQ